LPIIDDCLGQLSGAKLFFCHDLNSGYWYIEVEKKACKRQHLQHATTCVKFDVMLFELYNIPGIFERLLVTVSTGHNSNICLILFG
jgi:hypothetical protein